MELGKEVNDLKANDKSTKQDAEALLNKLKDAKKASEKEGHHDDTDPGQFQNWIDNLTAHMKAKGWLDGQETKPDANKANADDFDAKLKAAGDDKAKLLNLLQATTDPVQRAKIKAKFYYPGYSNVTADDLKDETKAKALLRALKTVVDTSDEYDFTNLKNVTATKSGDKWVITADSTFAKGSPAKLKYTFKETVDGELIFVGTKEDQHYVLQKNNQGVHLMQYDYLSGHGSYDVKAAG